MEKRFTILDERDVWHGPATAAARARGYDAQRIARGNEAQPGGLGFIRPHALPKVLEQNHTDFAFMDQKLTMVQDWTQVELYEDKSAQYWRFGEWMPHTWRFTDIHRAREFLLNRRDTPAVLVSKADVGASSVNVRVLHNRKDQLAHVQQIFGKGIPVQHCAGGRGVRDAVSVQRGYVLFQEYIPHEITWRVNIIGRARAIFKRYNKPGTLTAQTGNVEPVMELDDATNALLEYSDRVFAAIDSKWCALDILIRDGKHYLIETSLAWPWPSPGNCMAAPFFGPTTRNWAGIWDLMLDEYEAGVWAKS